MPIFPPLKRREASGQSSYRNLVLDADSLVPIQLGAGIATVRGAYRQINGLRGFNTSVNARSLWDMITSSQDSDTHLSSLAGCRLQLSKTRSMPRWNSGTSFLPVMEEGELADPHDEDGEL
ncbi:hypothetical protein FOBRF1_001141 [Fusarium oxysporum]